MARRNYQYKRDAMLRALNARKKGLVAKVRRGKQGWIVYAYKKKTGGE